MRVTIARAQRDALYEGTRCDLTWVGDIYLALINGESEGARRLWRRFGPTLQPLDVIGWSPIEPRERFMIDMMLPEMLVRALGDLRRRAEQLVGKHLSESKEPGERAARRSGARRMPGRAIAARR